MKNILRKTFSKLFIAAHFFKATRDPKFVIPSEITSTEQQSFIFVNVKIFVFTEALLTRGGCRRLVRRCEAARSHSACFSQTHPRIGLHYGN